MKICIDPGHGMGNKIPGRYDPGAVCQGVEEATIAMQWANELREILKARGHEVTRTRIDAKDPAPVGGRAAIARSFGCEVMLSIHCNAANGTANGTETFYRGEGNKALAQAVNDAVVSSLGTRSRGVKTEASSQHARLAVLNFPRCVLLEIGFIDHAADRKDMMDATKRRKACEALATALTA
jgi:N-acetylmuramoyl-L-alanine amidase